MSQQKTKNNDINILRKLFGYAKPYKWIFALVAFLSIYISGASSLRAYISKEIINNYIVPKDYEGLLYASLLLVGILLSEIISQISFAYYSGWIGQMVIYDIRKKLFSMMLRFNMKYHNQSSVGVLITRAVNDLERIGEIFSAGFFEIISDILKMLLIMSLMLLTDWKLSLLTFLTLPIIIYATHLFQKASKAAFTDIRREVANLNSFVQERITGIKVVQLFTREEQEYKAFQEINEKHKKAWLRNILQNSIYFPIAEILSSIAIALVIWYGGLQVVHHEMASLGVIFMFVQLVQELYRPLRHIADKFTVLQMGMVAAGRVFDIMDEGKETQEDAQGGICRDIEGNIQFDKVTFGYKKEEEILHGISFSAQQGETIAIVGATGAGKSTVIQLLSRFYKANSGKIFIDGVDCNDYNLENYRKQISVVLQDVFLFADSIFYNITLGDENISLEQVKEAAKEIGIHDFIEQLPNGYFFDVKERGAVLSAGQRQLISFLRAYVHKPKILILDEATASVDSHSEKLLQQATEKITQGRTSIIIAHRLSTIRKADKIIVMNKGNIVEEGSHEQLLQVTNGYYKNLYDMQFSV
ncbi:ABC transporter ATP-binding protein [uncultured Capnocytophaga sp.]|uniref:ABC transporter ATP-binding protein n=1 Tax=uncultured Capnocytophaga sp. TaxID=159273 RepID=UPI002614AF36|nr:ABC transporter ATP-binding protein [uncultured Capnocytophaga sp.]